MPSTPRPERPAPPVDVALVPLALAGAAIFWLPAATTGTSATRAIAALALGALLALAFSRDPFAANRRVIWGGAGLLALTVWYLTSRGWAIDPGGSMLEAGRVAAFALGVYAAHVSLVRATSRVLALAVIGAAALVVALPDLWDVVRHGAPIVRDAGFIGYWNATAIIALTLAPLAALLIRSRRFGLALLAAPLLAAAIASTAVTASRGALAATLIGLVVVAVLDSDRRLATGISIFVTVVLAVGVGLLTIERIPGWISLLVVFVLAINGAIGFRRVGLRPISLTGAPDDAPKRMTRLRLVGGVICAAAAVVVIALAAHASNSQTKSPAASQATAAVRSQPDLNRLASTDDSRRVEWWKQAARDWRSAPVAGQGGDAFETLGSLRADAQAEHTHSIVLQVLVEVGAVGLVLALFVAALLGRASLQATRTPERAAAAAIAVMVLAQTLIDWTWSLPQVMFVLALAVGVALPRPLPAHGEVPLAPLRLVFGALGAIAVLAIAAVLPFAADLLIDQSARDFDAKRYASAARYARQSGELAPSLDALFIEVQALEREGHTKQSRNVLREAQPVWLHRPDGLLFAQSRLANDPTYGPIIERESARQARIAADTTPSP